MTAGTTGDTTMALAPAPENLAACSLFSGLSPQQLASVAALVTPRRLESGASLVLEGEIGQELFIIHEGSVEVTKRAASSDRDQRIATLNEGAALGEITFIDRGPRSATVRTLAPTLVGVLPMDQLDRLAADDRDIERQMLRNVASELSRRLRFTNETTVTALERQLELERTRAMMGRFVVFMAFQMVTYTLALRLATDVLPANITPSALTVPLILAWSAGLLWLIKRSGLPFEVFGVTLRGWRPALREALRWTFLVCAAATVFKLVLIWTNPAFAGERLFNLSGVLDPRTSTSDLWAALALAVVYGVLAPIQEFIIRGGLQTSLQRCLVGPSATLRAVLVSNALFASAHFHLSLGFAVVVFFPGLLWGALFARQRNLVGVSLSHVLCGWFGFLVVGFEPWY
jgi:CRP/FNR family transcriptional regulator, cyclic AMP receptor protein